jgi:membrane protein DedA with SNARE-associated domain
MVEMIPDIFQTWLIEYGSLALFILLALGIIALPIPEETLLVFSGVLINQGIFNLIPTALSALAGSIVGITGSYLIGATGGLYIIHKFGSYVGFTQAKLDRAHAWAEHYGKWVLFIGYFIPGVRHFTGIFAGISSMEFRHFALYAYFGALCWVTTFLTIGYFFGNWHQQVFELIESNLEIMISVIVTAVVITLLLWMRRKKQKSVLR